MSLGWYRKSWVQHKSTHPWFTIIPSFRDTRLCHSCSYIAVENEAHFVLECPLIQPYKRKVSVTTHQSSKGSLKYFFQWDHQVDISLYLTEATARHHSGELASLKPSWCTSKSHYPFCPSKLQKSISFHLINGENIMQSTTLNIVFSVTNSIYLAQYIVTRLCCSVTNTKCKP